MPLDCNRPPAGCSGHCKHRWVDIAICGDGQVQYAVASTLFNNHYDLWKGSTSGLFKSTDFGATWTQPIGPHSGTQACVVALHASAQHVAALPLPLACNCSPQRPPFAVGRRVWRLAQHHERRVQRRRGTWHSVQILRISSLMLTDRAGLLCVDTTTSAVRVERRHRQDTQQAARPQKRSNE